MALPVIFSGSKKKRDQILAIDLGTRTTKAVAMQRRGDVYVLSRYVLLDAPIFDKAMPPEMLAEHLKAVSQAIDSKSRMVSVTTNVTDALVRHIDIPRMPLDDMRLILKHNSRNYLQQDLQNYVFDCHVMPEPTSDSAKPTSAVQKQKVLVAGGKAQFVNDLVESVKNAGLIADGF